MPSEIKQRMQTTHTSCETIDQLGNRHELRSSSQPQGMQNLYLFNTPSLANLTNTGLILSVSGQLAASGGIRCNILLSSGVLSLFPGLPLAKFYPQWIHSRSTKGVDGFGHYPWNLHCPLPQALLYLLHRLYVTLPLQALSPEATEVSVHSTWAVYRYSSLPRCFSLCECLRREMACFLCSLQCSALHGHLSYNDEKSASTSSHLNVSHFRLLDFSWFPKQTAQSNGLISG